MNLKIILSVVCLLAASCSYYFFATDNKVERTECANLEAIGKNEALVRKIESWYTEVLDSPKLLDHVTKKEGYVFFRTIPSKYHVDLEALGISIENATFMFFGDDINYKHFDINKVEAVGLGEGYRGYLVFTLKNLEGFEERYKAFGLLKKINAGIYLRCR